MERSTVIFIAICAATIALYILYLIRTTPKRRSLREQRRYGAESEWRVYNELCRTLGSERVIKTLYFPVPTKEGTFDTEVDCICVTRQGIAVIEVKGSKGLIDNPEKGRWCQRHGDKVMYFDDPYEQNRTHVKALQRILDEKGFHKPHLYNTVVFSDSAVQFTHSYDWLLGIDELDGYIRGLESGNILSRYEIKQLVRVLKHYRIPRNTTFKQKYRNRS
ncbi:MAG: NERD domain-containing protein [Ruminococcaceae bacterium]|nr:NERD domain-containing protein [Oscillospiraceae bacterium]